MFGTTIQFILLLIAHAAAGIYSSTLKYSKRTTYIIWGSWVLLQAGLLFYTEFVLTDWALQFFVGFVLSLAGQYLIFFATTKGKLAQRVFTMLTYSIFFCIIASVFAMIDGTFVGLHWIPVALIHAVLLLAMVTYFLRYVCTLCRAASKNITTGWTPLIFVNCVFLVTIILSAVFPVRLVSFNDPAVITFIFLSISIMAMYPVIFSNINITMKNMTPEMNEKAKMEMQELNDDMLDDVSGGYAPVINFNSDEMENAAKGLVQLINPSSARL